VLSATKKVMDQLAAVYPELGKTHPTIPKGIVADGTITRDVKEFDLDNAIEEVETPGKGKKASSVMAERDQREEHAEGPNPADQGMLSWLGFGSDANRGLVSSDAIGERDLMNLLEGIAPSPSPPPQRAESEPSFPTNNAFHRSMRQSAPDGKTQPDAVPEEDEEASEEEADEGPPSLQDFTVECGLGTGGFAAVVLVEHNKTGKIYAVKTMLKSRITREKQIERIGTERRVLMDASDHPFISRMHFAFQNHRQLFFVLDFCAGGDLYYHLTRMKNSRFKHFSEEATQFYVAELILAIDHLHQQGIVYRDLKLENVMLDEEGHVKLVDFGLSKEGVSAAYEQPLSPCGSILYLAPELLEMTGGTSVDWWTMGILMHEMLTGKSPWKSETQNAVLNELRGKTPVKLSKELSSRAAAIISGLVTRNPRKRLGSRGAGELKKHPFFLPRLKQASDWKKLLKRGFPPPIRPCKTKLSAPPAQTAASSKPAMNRHAGVRNSDARNSEDFAEMQKTAAAEEAQAKLSKREALKRADRVKAAAQKQYGMQNFEKSQRNLAIKSVAFPDPSNEGSVGVEFEGFVMSEVPLTIKPNDLAEIRRMSTKQNR